MKLRQDFEKELEELYKKFDIKHKENEAEVQKVRKDLDKQHSIVNVNMKLAEACRVKSMDFTLPGAPNMHKGIFLVILTLVIVEISMPFIVLLLVYLLLVYLLLPNIFKLLLR